ncbi:replication associated protein [Chifec virus UA13_1817]|uniref:Replication-associated protein n=1 Tax=Chifec virus UA13_1817 TaxID=2914456 RepID=A0AAX3A6Q4_9CIRC|nr:replication associated protein [Chifec virus UA13_1817]UNY50596.1 replication associated protein [Chifec virus UA13_1817]
MPPATLRRFCFTWNNYSEEDWLKAKSFIEEKCKYGIIGKEQCPTTGTPHIQGFCNLSKPMRFGTIKQHLSNTIHIEKANGSDEDNQRYCGKSGETFEKGNPCRQGQRSDLQSAIHDITTERKTLRQIALDHPTVFIRYHRGIKEYMRITLPIKVRDFKTDVFYYWGPPGSGKSKRALEEAKSYNADSIYYKPRGLWWDGYEQHDCVIIDDFYGWIKYDELLKIMDRYPYKVQIKGGFEEFTTKKIWITSNVDVDDLYKFIGYKTDAIERRITNKVYMD